MAGFYLSNKQITGQNLKYIYGGPKPFLKLKSPRESKTFQLRCKEKEEDRVEATQKRMRRRLFDSNSRGELVVPKAPAFKEVSQTSVDEIVSRLNRPKTAPIRHNSDKKETKKEKKQTTTKPVTERDIRNISSRLHCHETYMSQVRNSRGVKLPPPRRKSALERAKSAPSQRTNFIEMIRKWNLYQKFMGKYGNLYNFCEDFKGLECIGNVKIKHLRTKEKEEQKVEALQRRMRRRLFDANSRGEYVVPRAPAFRELDQEGVDEIVTRLNHPKSAPPLRRSQSTKSSSEESECGQRPKTLSERELSDISIRLHNHETHMSRARSGKGVRFPLPCSKISVDRANSSHH